MVGRSIKYPSVDPPLFEYPSPAGFPLSSRHFSIFIGSFTLRIDELIAIGAPMTEELRPQFRKQRKLKTFAHLSANDFIHPWDAKALKTLRAVPGLDTITRKFLELGLERVYHLERLADNIQVSPRSFPAVHRSAQWAAKILGVEVPPVFVSLNPEFNASTVGHTKPFITISSSLIELLSDEELLFVLGHEIGHIKCDHVLYGVVAQNIRAILDALGRATLGIGNLVGTGLALPLLDWYRKAELSADRAALLCVQDPEVGIQTFMKLAGGTTQLSAQLDRDDFIAQVKAYEDRDFSNLDKAYKIYLTMFRTHPYPIMRAKHLMEWVRNGEYTKVSGLEHSWTNGTESADAPLPT